MFAVNRYMPFVDTGMNWYCTFHIRSPCLSLAHLSEVHFVVVDPMVSQTILNLITPYLTADIDLPYFLQDDEMCVLFIDSIAGGQILPKG